jgi:hypothetical protein
MQKILAVFIIIILALLFALPSMSQSHASAKQAQAVIETSRAAQIASAGNLIIIATLSLLLLYALGVIGYLLWRARQHAASPRWVSGPNANWGQQIPTPDANAMLPTLMAALLVQVMSNQHQQSRPAEPDSIFRPRYELESLQTHADDDFPWTSP